MADIQNVRQPNPNDHLTGKQKIDADAKKFQEQMKVREVDPADPEQRNKKKFTAEDEEETNPLAPEPPPPTGTFSLNPQESIQSPFDIQGGSRTSPLSSAAPQSAPSPLNSFTPTSPLDEDVDEEDFSFETTQDFGSTSSTPTYTQPQPSPELSSPYAVENPQAPSLETPAAPKKEESETVESKKIKKTPLSDEPVKLDKEKLSLEDGSLEGLKQAPFEMVPKVGMGGKEGIEKPVKGVEKTPISGIQGRAVEEKEEEELAALLNPPSTLKTETSFTDKPSPLSPTPYSYLPSHVLELLEKMAGVMIVMQATGKTETIFTLGSESRFAGTKISIETFAHAPGAFNIKLEGTPESTAIFNACSKDLMAAFQYGNYNFRVHRLDVSLLRTERDIVQRKENASGEQDNQPG